MHLIINNLRIPVEKDGSDEYVKAASKRLQLSERAITLAKVLHKSLDMTNKEEFFYRISIVARVPVGYENKAAFPLYRERPEPHKKLIVIKERPVIIGFGPAGIFAALELIEHGLRPLIFERGKKIEERSIDIRRFINDRELDPESNIQFGEGGAGSYSDGKLFARQKNSYYAEKVLTTFIKFGAPEETGYMHKPHLGTDVLCRIVKNIRDYILERGGEINYESKVTDILIADGRTSGVVINGDKEYYAPMTFLAPGNSARDTFEMLYKKGVALEQKQIFVGTRIEHPAETINLMRYGYKYKDFQGLDAATYSLNFTDRKRGIGVYTFCMCPGGEVINASSENSMMVVNGMSYSSRASSFSNAALVTACHTNRYKSVHPLAGIEFQKDIERKAFDAAGGGWKAPAQNMVDFLCGKLSDDLNENSYRMGTSPADMNTILPDFVTGALLAAFDYWRDDYPLFVSDRAILLGAETRTSSPVKIVRSRQYESVNTKNLYPIGEGAGYAGGITSSAADAIRAVECSLEQVDL